MSTRIVSGPVLQRVVNTSVAANNPIVLAIGGAPPAGCVTVVDWITFGYLGTTQTSASINVQQAGGGTTYWLTYAAGPAAGLGGFHWDFPGGLCPSTAAEAIEFTAATMTNCAMRATVGYHVERLS